MSILVVDARGWQNTLNLKTGERVKAAGPVIEMVKSVLQNHQYPGDTDPGSNRWVTDTALDLVDRYNPRFVFLTYAAQYFSARYTQMTEEMRARAFSEAFLEAERFMDGSGFAAIVVGTGDMTPLIDYIYTTGLDGVAICTHWSTKYAGLYKASPADMEFLRKHPHIEKIVSREEVVRLFDGTPEQALRVPEYLMVARKGYAFKTVSGTMKIPVMIPSQNFDVPVYAPDHTMEAITGIRRALEEDLSIRNVALIALEGVGLNDFLWPYLSCRNGKGWHYYEPGEGQYLSITCGEHRFMEYPTGSGYKYFNDKEEAVRRTYPFSGLFRSIPQGTFASTFAPRSIAVGNKSMFIHMITGADICVECFARNLYNQGTMAVIHRENKL